jgi:DNA-binding winged helix-turn-helix (wHTH) protein
MQVGRSFRLGKEIVRVDANEIVRHSRTYRVEPKAMAVLVRLAKRAGQVLSHDELLSGVWPAAAVSEGVLTRCISKLRHALGDSREKSCIQTIPTRGYRLNAAVESLERSGRKVSGGKSGL